MSDNFILKSKGKKISIVPKTDNFNAAIEDFVKFYKENNAKFNGLTIFPILWNGEIDYEPLLNAQREGLIIEVLRVDKDDIDFLVKKQPKVYKGLLRCGDCIKNNDDIIIEGTVNNGARVEADGDIYIFGTLKGTVCAGIEGDYDKRIFVANCEDSLVMIGGISAYIKKKDIGKNGGPKVIYVKNNNIVIEKM